MANEIEEALRSCLVNFAAVAALTQVGTTGDYLIRPDRLQQDDDETSEQIVIEVDSAPQNDLDGLGGLVYAEVTLRCRAPTKQQARALAEAVRVNGTDPGTGLAGYHGAAGDLTIDAVLEARSLDFLPIADGGDSGQWEVACEYRVSFTRT